MVDMSAFFYVRTQALHLLKFARKMERKVYPSDDLSGYVVSLILPAGLFYKKSRMAEKIKSFC